MMPLYSSLGDRTKTPSQKKKKKKKKKERKRKEKKEDVQQITLKFQFSDKMREKSQQRMRE